MRFIKVLFVKHLCGKKFRGEVSTAEGGLQFDVIKLAKRMSRASSQPPPHPPSLSSCPLYQRLSVPARSQGLQVSQAKPLIDNLQYDDPDCSQNNNLLTNITSYI